jgi:hypothetical protein
MNPRPRTLLAIVGGSNDREHLEADNRAARNAAYRRLALTMLGLDVATLAGELRTARIQQDPSHQLAA